MFRVKCRSQQALFFTRKSQKQDASPWSVTLLPGQRKCPRQFNNGGRTRPVIVGPPEQMTRLLSQVVIMSRNNYQFLFQISSFDKTQDVRSEEHTSELQSLRHLVC